MSAWRPVVLVLLPFGAGYLLSYVFRTINALIAGDLAETFQIGPQEMGLLTSVYFLAMAVVQIPLGVCLDRYGPRRVQGACLIIAALGAATFAAADSLAGLLIGRALIGLGFAAALMSGLKAAVLWFPKERIGQANGVLVMIGALGAVAATLPAETLILMFGWRGLFVLLAGLSGLAALVMMTIVPEHAAECSAAAHPPRVRLRDIYADRQFQRIAPLSTLCIGTSWSLQGLWAAPWLADVDGLSRAEIVNQLLVMGLALSVSAMALGTGADWLRARGVARETVLAAVAGIFVLAQIALIVRLPVPSTIAWAVIAGVGAATVLSFAILPGYFPKEMSARANAALNILHLTGAFVMQSATGVIVDLWPALNGRHPVEAYQAAFGISVALQVTALIWFLVSAVRARVPIYRVRAGCRSAVHARSTRQSISIYAEAQHQWADRVSAARIQTARWRTAAIGSSVLCMVLGGAVVSAVSTRSIPHIIATDDAAKVWLGLASNSTPFLLTTGCTEEQRLKR